MQMHARKRLEIVVEKQRQQAVLDILDGDGEVTGYTILNCDGGRGHHGDRIPQPFSNVFDNVMIICILKPEVADRVIENLAPLIDQVVGIIALSDVQVMRAGHF